MPMFSGGTEREEAGKSTAVQSLPEDVETVDASSSVSPPANAQREDPTIQHCFRRVVSDNDKASVEKVAFILLILLNY